MIIIRLFRLTALMNQNKIDPRREKKNGVSFRIAIKNAELVREYFPKHLRMETARMKEYKETEEDTQKREKIESKAGTK